MFSHSVSPAQIDWAAKANKRHNDTLVMGVISEEIQNRPARGQVSCLTFPAAEWLWEQTLGETFPDIDFRVLGIERDPVVFNRTRIHQRKINNLGGNLELFTPGCASDFSHALRTVDPGRGFDIVYPDYMGTWSQAKRAELSQVFSRGFLAKHGFLFVTLALTRVKALSREELNPYVKMDYAMQVTDTRRIRHSGHRKTEVPLIYGLPGLICDLAREHGQELEIRPVHVYYSTSATTNIPQPEALFMFQRVA